MKLKKFLLAIGVVGLLLTGCDTTKSSDTEPEDSETSEITEAERFSAIGYSALKGWPTAVIKTHYTREGVETDWFDANILMPEGVNQNTQVYVRNYEDVMGADVFLNYEVVRVTEDITTFTNYAALFRENANFTNILDEEAEYAITALEGKVQIAVRFAEESEEVPSATYFRYTVQEKEEFPGAPKADRSASRTEIKFSNDFKITTRSKELVEWSFSDIYKFSVAVGESTVKVGNIPNNNGIGYLTPQLRVYKDQVLTLRMVQGTVKQIIFHGVNFTENGENVNSVDAFPAVEGAQRFNTETSVLYHIDADDATTLSLVVTANARLLDVTVIYFV
ncbi:MAG: hypothetical protein BWX74_00075 [Tenericutes bacterium ADurb.Bin087]|nr:MAG: hypothetical protein BWX74_00075 [Tenericutes bacterium ADurb.Bin087]